MRSKLVRFYSSIYFSLFSNSKCSLGVNAIAIFFVILGSGSANARMTITPTNGGTINGPFTEATIGVTPTITFYYRVAGSLSGGAFDASGVTRIDTTFSAATDPSLSTPATANLFTFKVLSNEALPSGQQGVITLVALPDTGGSSHPAPIAAVNGVACSSTNINCVAFNQVNPTFNHYYAALYNGFETTVSVYLNDICKDAQLAAGDLTGCSAGAFIQPTNGSPTLMQLKFSIMTSPDSNALTVPSGSAVDTMSVPVSLSVQSDTPTFLCQSQATLAGLYLPGDSSIRFFPREQSGFGASLLALGETAGQAPAVNIVVVANDGSAPDVSSNFETLNEIHQSVTANKSSSITGFKNSTSALEHPYQMSAIIQDGTGVFIPPSNASACIIEPVFAADISGFLGSSNCFIATATFEDNNAMPVELFRQFRDQILLKSTAGTQFVDWYYSWSPSGADWLQSRPWIRASVLYGLFPLELFAWLVLHPLLFVGTLAAISLATVRWRAQ